MQSGSAKAENAIEVGKEHLDLLASALRHRIERACRTLVGEVSCDFVCLAADPAGVCVAAKALQTPIFLTPFEELVHRTRL